MNRALQVDMDFATEDELGGGGGIAFDSAGTLYLGAPFDNLVMRVKEDVIEKVAALKRPSRLALGRENELFVMLSPGQRGDEPIVRLIALPGG